MCGEKFLEVVQPIAQWGSPPRMRGKAEKNGGFCPGVGITPAYAGKSADCVMTETRDGDHPRVCGEKCVSRVR